MVWCSVKNCTSCLEDNYGKQGADIISFHSFPDDTIMKQQWIRAVGRPNWTPTAHSRICSKHFTQSSFYGFGRLRKVNDLAVPTLSLPGPDLKMVTVHIPSANKQVKKDVEKKDQVGRGPFPIAISAVGSQTTTVEKPKHAAVISASPPSTTQPKSNNHAVFLKKYDNGAVIKKELIKVHSGPNIQYKNDPTLMRELTSLRVKVQKMSKSAQKRMTRIRTLRQKCNRLLKKQQEYDLILDEILEKGSIDDRPLEITASTSERRDIA